MRILVNVSPNFYRFAPLILRRISATEPNLRVNAVVLGGDHIYEEFIRRIGGLTSDRLHNLLSLEREWLARPYDPGRLREYEKLMGRNAVNRIIIADRMIGHGYIRGGIIAQTPLSRFCTNDETRHRYLTGILDFFYNWFKNNPPDVILAYGVAGAITLTMCLMAEHFNIEIRRINSIRLGDRNILDTSYLNLGMPLKKLYESALEDESLVAETRDKAQAVLQQAREDPKAPDYHMAVRKSVLILPPAIDLTALIWRFMSRRPPESLASPYPLKRLSWELHRWAKVHWLLRFKQFDKQETLKGKNFVYYPLQFDPEAATMVLAPHATNQIMVLELLSKAIPAEWSLVVKDHYTMLGRRPTSFYKDLKSIPKVKVLPATVSSFSLIRASELVVTITGTAAWEAMLMGKPALMLGPTHFQNVGEGFVYEKNLTALDNAVEQALVTPPASKRALVLYLATMLKASFSMPGSILVDVSLSDSYLESQTEAIDAIALGIIEACRPIQASS